MWFLIVLAFVIYFCVKETQAGDDRRRLIESFLLHCDECDAYLVGDEDDVCSSCV